MWSLLPLNVSLLLVVLAVRGPVAGMRTNALIFASGVSGAVACWTKQTAVTGVLFVVLLACTGFMWDGTRNVRQRLSALLYWSAGAEVLSASIALYFSARGIFRECIYWCFVYDFSYAAKASDMDNFTQFLVRLVEIAQGDFLLLAIGIGVAIWSLFRGKVVHGKAVRRKPEGYFVVIFLALSLLGTIPGYAYRHYFAQLAPAVSLAAGYGLWVLLSKIRRPGPQVAAGICAGLAIVAVPVFANDQYFLERDPNEISRIYYGPNPFPESRELASFIARSTTPDDPILIVGSEPQILFYAQRRSSSRFLMVYPLLTTHARYKEFQRTLLAGVEKLPPRFIVSVMNVPYSLLWDNGADLDAIHTLEDLAQRDYDVERVMLLSGTAGEWIDPQDPRIDADHPFVSIFRKKP